MNPTVKISGLRFCACGCGAVNPQRQEGRPRQYLEGHYIRPSRRTRKDPKPCRWCRAPSAPDRRSYCCAEHARAARLFRQKHRLGGVGRVRRAMAVLAAIWLLGAA